MSLASPAPAAPESVAAEIIAIERAGLDGSDRGDVSMFLKLSTPDVVYMDPWQERPIVGIGDLTAYYQKIFKPEPKPTVAGVMFNAHVQVSGEMAVLTFNYDVTELATQKVAYRWNAVEVYTKRDGEWRIINTHWSYRLPRLAKD